MSKRIEDLLVEKTRSRVPAYELFGGLADNLMTIGPAAGRFLECSDCGETFTTKAASWQCNCCGGLFDLKVGPRDKKSSGSEEFKAEARFTKLSKPGISDPHWMHNNENWSVAEFAHQLLRSQPEKTLASWLRELGVSIPEGSQLVSVLCWPRFEFGGKTIQPDIVATFDKTIVLMEFKRFSGGITPGTEALGQAAFAKYAADYLGIEWSLLFVPSNRNEISRDGALWVSAMLESKDATIEKWPNTEGAIDVLLRESHEVLAKRCSTASWTMAVHSFEQVVREQMPASWTKNRILESLEYFLSARKHLINNL